MEVLESTCHMNTTGEHTNIAATATTGKHTLSATTTSADSNKRPRIYSAAPIGRSLQPHPQLAAISTAVPPAPRPPPPRIVNKGDILRIICGDYAGHTAQVRKPAKVGTHMIAGSHTVRVQNSVISMVILPDNFLWKSAWGASPVHHAVSSNTSSESGGSSLQRVQQEAARHSARSMGQWCT